MAQGMREVEMGLELTCVGSLLGGFVVVGRFEFDISLFLRSFVAPHLHMFQASETVGFRFNYTSYCYVSPC